MTIENAMLDKVWEKKEKNSDRFYLLFQMLHALN